ncbi:MAG TPA: glycosyltransferase family 4 protein [Vicinamibacterales bacterium]
MNSAPRPEVVYVLPDKMGGVLSYVRNLLRHRQPDGFDYAAVLTDNLVDPQTRSDESMPSVAREVKLQYSLPPENIWAVLRRLAAALGTRPGVIVANDWIELAMATVCDTGRSVVAINHGDFDFYYQLAVRHDRAIDAFVTYTERMADQLEKLLPHRSDSIHLIRYGVDVPPLRRTPVPGPLRLMYSGRLARDKGVFDLPEIAKALMDRGCRVQWTIQGTGPDEAALRGQWPDAATRWTGMQAMSAVLDEYQRQDVLVMPSRNEGLPVALLESAAAGVVPVVSNLPSGIPEVVTPGVTGFRPEPGDIRGFVEAIACLEADRPAVEAASSAVRRIVEDRYEVKACNAKYQRLYAELAVRPRTWNAQPLPYGSRLDQRWIPNSVVRLIRSAARRAS